MNRIIYLLVGLAFMVASVRATIPSHIELYHFYNKDYIAKMGPMPSQYKDRYQIPLDELGENPKFKVATGRSANVSTTGLIRPDCETWYIKGNTMSSVPMEGYERVRIDCTNGNTTINITAGGVTQQILVTVDAYANIWTSQEEDKILRQIITSGMTQLQKYNTITDWVADNTDYCGNFSGSTSMLVYGCGDCWASTSLILQMALKEGIDCWGRRGSQASGAGSGHMNACAFINGSYYVAEAGAVGTKPRYRNVFEEPFGFAISGSILYQYDGRNTSVVLPTQVKGKNMTQLGKGAYVFEHDITSLYIPASYEVIADAALMYTDTLKSLIVDPKNPNYVSVDNLLYTKHEKTLLYIPPTRTSVTIDPDTRAIGYAVFNDMKFDTLLIPGSVKSIDVFGFGWTEVNELILEDGLEFVNHSGFRYAKIPKVVLPKTITSLGQLVFYSSYIPEVIILSKKLKEIPRGTFRDSTVQRVIIPYGVEILGEDCFYNCRRLENITIPVTVKTFHSNVFSSVTKRIFYMGTEEEWNKIFFNTTIPESIEVLFNSEPEDPCQVYSNEKNKAQGEEFPDWGIAVCVCGGAALVAAAVIVAVVVVKKKNSGGSGSVEMNSVSVRD